MSLQTASVSILKTLLTALRVPESNFAKCRCWQAPTSDGTGCTLHDAWLVIFFIVTASIPIIIAIVSVIVTIVNSVLKMWRREHVCRKVCVFTMNWSDGRFVILGDRVSVCARCVAFEGKIRVDVESRELTCVGNEGK